MTSKMEVNASHLPLLLLVAFVAVAPATSADSGPLPPYTNHTVGDTSGWLFDPATNTPATNYSAWAAKQSFYLGDFLIFHTNSNMTVVQTYNATTYDLCSQDQDFGNLTTSYGINGTAGNGGLPGVVTLPLTEEGDNYYFSDTFDGVQCENGMRFHIVVSHGHGLPPELNQPPPPPFADPYLVAPPPSSPADSTTTGQGEIFHNGAGSRGLMGFFPSSFLLLVHLWLLLLLPPAFA